MRNRGVVLIVTAAAATAVVAWATRGPVTRPSLVVRVEYDGSADDARIADGLATEITRLLAQVEGLDVRAAARASRYGEQREDTHTFGEARDAGLVLEGLVLTDSSAVRRIQATLVSTPHRTTRWSRWFTPAGNDVFAAEDAIVAAVAELLGLRVRPGQGQHSMPPALQTAFLRARALQAEGGHISRPEAVDLFEQITKQVPTFTPAFAALATTLGGHLSIAGPPPLEPRMAAAAQSAYKADPHLPEANVAMGLLSARTCRWTHADAYFAEALRIDPNATSAPTDYVISTLLPQGRIAEALDVLRSAVAANPSSADVRRTLTYVQLQNKDYAAATETSGWVIAHHPDMEFADQSHGRSLYLSQRIEDALVWFSRSDSQWGHRGYVASLIGRHAEARALVEAHPREPARQMLIYAGLKDVERAIDALRRTALDDPWRALVWMNWPEIEPVLRGDPRASAIRAQLLRPAEGGVCAL